MLWCWACNRILITSIGVTTATASVTPAARPAVIYRLAIFAARLINTQLQTVVCHILDKHKLRRAQSLHLPRNRARPFTCPLSSARNFLYASKLVNRIAILGTIPVTTAPRPLYRPRGVSFRTISAPVARKPRFGAPGVRARRESCMRTLTVSRTIVRA
jgi:hypothetical protein